MTGRRAPRFGLYFDANKVTSGQRFWSELKNAFREEISSFSDRPDVMLFNVSAPLMAILQAKAIGCKVVLRLDGLYMDRISDAFLQNFRVLPVRFIRNIFQGSKGMEAYVADLANFLNRNYGSFLKAFFSDLLIYQSRFSRVLHMRYFPGKPHVVITNGSPVRCRNDFAAPKDKSPIRLITIYDPWRMSKRIGEIIRFIRYAQESKGLNIRLCILGYDRHRRPRNITDEDDAIVRKGGYIDTRPPYTEINDELVAVMESSHAFIGFSFRDSCPNAVVEAMACGLPVVGVASGGVPDIVGDAGVLLRCDDFADGYHAPHRFEDSFPPIDFDAMANAVEEVVSSNQHYRDRVRRRFASDLDISVVALRYREAALSLIH